MTLYQVFAVVDNWKVGYAVHLGDLTSKQKAADLARNHDSREVAVIVADQKIIYYKRSYLWSGSWCSYPLGSGQVGSMSFDNALLEALDRLNGKQPLLSCPLSDQEREIMIDYIVSRPHSPNTREGAVIHVLGYERFGEAFFGAPDDLRNAVNALAAHKLANGT